MSLLNLLEVSDNANIITRINQEDITIKLLLAYKNEIRTDFERIQNYLFYQSYVKHENDSLFASGSELKRFDSINELLFNISDLSIRDCNTLINKYFKDLITEHLIYKNEIIAIAPNNGIDKTVKEYLFDVCYHDLLIPKNFKLYATYLKKNPSTLRRWLSKIIESKVYYTDSSIIKNIDILKSSEFNEIILWFNTAITNSFSQLVSSDLCGTEDDQVFYLYERFYHNWLKYLKDTKSAEVYKFEALEIVTMQKFEQVITKYGQTYNNTVDMSEIMDLFKKEISKHGVILFEYTHRVDDKKSVFESLEEAEGSVFDSIFQNENKSFFTNSRVTHLNYMMAYLSSFMQHIIYNESELLVKALKSYAEVIDSYYCISETYKLKKDFESLTDILKNVSKSDKDSELTCILSIANYYGPTMYMCSLIEKILRNFYKYQRRNIDFTNNKSVTLNYLLSEKNSEIVDLLGIAQLRVAKYYLLSDENDEGWNIRNDLAHLNYEHDEQTFFRKFLTTAVLLFSVISSVVLSSLKN